MSRHSWRETANPLTSTPGSAMPRLQQSDPSVGVIAAAPIAPPVVDSDTYSIGLAGPAMPASTREAADSCNRSRGCLGALTSARLGFSEVPLAASAQESLGNLQPSVRPSSRSSPRHRGSAFFDVGLTPREPTVLGGHAYGVAQARRWCIRWAFPEFDFVGDQHGNLVGVEVPVRRQVGDLSPEFDTSLVPCSQAQINHAFEPRPRSRVNSF